MSEVIVCPSCKRRIRLPAHLLGKPIKCPGCNTGFVAGGEPPPGSVTPEPPLVEPEPDLPTVLPEPEPVAAAPSELPTTDLTAWRGVRNGVGIQGLAHVLYLLGIGAFTVTSFIVIVSKNESPSKASVTFVMLLGAFTAVSFLSHAVMSVVAQSSCVLGPTQPATRAWSVACLALSVLVVFQGGTALDLSHFGGAPPETSRLSAAEALLTWLFLEVGRLTVLALFLRGLGGEKGKQALATTAMFLAIGTPALFLLNFLMWFFWNVIVRPNMTSEKFPDVVSSREVDWVGWLLMNFNLLSLVIVLLVGVLLMFRVWQALGPKPAVAGRRNVA